MVGAHLRLTLQGAKQIESAWGVSAPVFQVDEIRVFVMYFTALCRGRS